ncbi:restriction endonuclease subunit S, partial [Vibrio parahaemolyticus]|nr:restriction endonuclease subunit S [Vibrio parahaemolyticus]
MSAEKLITDHIDIWTSAVQAKSSSGRGSGKKRELYGIKKLRELILELAVRGKLVPQDPSDEPASVLLERIAAEKAQLVKEKKIKKPKALSKVAEEAKPFNLPVGWDFERLDVISHKITDGEHISPAKLDTGVKLLSAKHILDGGISLEEPQFVSHEDAEKFRLRCDPSIGDVLICRRGTIGRCCTVTFNEYFCLMGSVILVRPPTKIVSKYLSYFLKSPVGQVSIKDMTKGMA